MERLDIVGRRGQVGRFRTEQIAQRSTWTQVPTSDVNPRPVFGMHVIHHVPENASTVTTINPLDVQSDCYLDNSDACGCEHTIGIGRRL